MTRGRRGEAHANAHPRSHWTSIDLSHPLLAEGTGRGVSVAVIDSGVHPAHPHVGRVTGGVSISHDGSVGEEFPDLLGHGTAVAAAIREKAPDAEIHVVKVFDRALATSLATLIRAIDWSVDRGVRLINLSLGMPRSGPELALWASVQRASDEGVLLVSPREHDGTAWLPGCLDGVAGVDLDWSCRRDEVRVWSGSDAAPRFRASGLPRPIPGVPPERNVRGISFAAANLSGMLARVFERHPDLRTAADVARALSADPGAPESDEG